MLFFFKFFYGTDLPPPVIDENTHEILTEQKLEEKTENDLIFLLVDVVSISFPELYIITYEC